MGVYILLALAYLRNLIPPAYAQAPPLPPPPDGENTITLVNPLGTQSFEDVLQLVVSGLTKIAIPIVALMFVIGGIMIMTAGGNPEKFKKGRDVLLYAAIGFAVLLVATSIVAIVKSILGAE